MSKVRNLITYEKDLIAHVMKELDLTEDQVKGVYTYITKRIKELANDPTVYAISIKHIGTMYQKTGPLRRKVGQIKAVMKTDTPTTKKLEERIEDIHEKSAYLGYTYHRARTIISGYGYTNKNSRRQLEENQNTGWGATSR
jgi:NACalpha-BTF3-like transcription factor